jgi:hypothetical protein
MRTQRTQSIRYVECFAVEANEDVPPDGGVRRLRLRQHSNLTPTSDVGFIGQVRRPERFGRRQNRTPKGNGPERRNSRRWVRA